MVDLSRLKKMVAESSVSQVSTDKILWKGPVEDGVTFSMLNRFLSCRERFRLATVYGLRSADVFDHKIQYGHMWHECEQALSAKTNWMQRLEAYHTKLQEKYKFQNIPKEIYKWYMVCRTQFPIYVAYWQKHKDNTHRTPLFQEYTFDVPYDIGGGRKVRMRGKVDAGDLIGKGTAASVYVQENKTKGDIDEESIKKQLYFDCQTMFYLTALQSLQKIPATKRLHTNLPPELFTRPLAGVRYNVIRRPLSGGKGNIKQHKPTNKNPGGESDDEFYARLGEIIDGTGKNRNGDDQPSPEYFFMRWQAEISKDDISLFETRFLKPILNQLVDWYEWIRQCHEAVRSPFDSMRPDRQNTIHWQHPYGVTNMINEGFSHDLDEHLRTGTTVGLRRIERLFEELN